MSEKQADKSKSVSQAKHIPKDALVIMSIMKEIGIPEYDPRVISQLLEFTYRYITCILDDAKVYATHAKKKSIDLDDVRLALNTRLEKSFISPPPRDLLIETARQKNNIPLPLIKPHCGIRLPQDKYCLASCNVRLKHMPFHKICFDAHSAFTSRSKDIPKVLQYSGPLNENSGLSPCTANLVKRTGLPIMPKSQTVTIPKPIKYVTTLKKPKLNISQASTITIDDDDSNPLKRKRDDDDYEVGLW